MGEGPFFYLVLPVNEVDSIPVNATKLLREWEAFLDPLEAISEIASWAVRDSLLGPPEFTETDRFVEVTSSSAYLLREAARERTSSARFPRDSLRGRSTTVGS